MGKVPMNRDEKNLELKLPIHGSVVPRQVYSRDWESTREEGSAPASLVSGEPAVMVLLASVKTCSIPADLPAPALLRDYLGL